MQMNRYILRIYWKLYIFSRIDRKINYQQPPLRPPRENDTVNQGTDIGFTQRSYDGFPE